MHVNGEENVQIEVSKTCSKLFVFLKYGLLLYIIKKNVNGTVLLHKNNSVNL